MSSSIPPSSDRKRKSKEMSDDDAPDERIHLLPQMVEMLQAMKEQDERGDSIASRRNQDIYKAKLQVNDIHAMKRALDEYSNRVFSELLEKQEDRIRGLFDSTSPLLSLNKPILRHLIGYLDEEALLSLEEASTTVKRYFASDALVELHDRRKQQQQQKRGYFPIALNPKAVIREPTPRERAHCYKMASSFAREMETAAASHYDYDQVAVEKPKLKKEKKQKDKRQAHSFNSKRKEKAHYEDMHVDCSGCKALDDMVTPCRAMSVYGSEDDCVFVRLSYRTTPVSQSPLIWEGFVSHRKYSKINVYYDEYAEDSDQDEFDEAVINMGSVVDEMNWPEMMDYMAWINLNTDDDREEKGELLEHITANLQLTVVLLSKSGRLFSSSAPQGEGAYLLVATGGFEKRGGDRGGTSRRDCVYLKPRNKQMHSKVWNPRNFLETSISLQSGTKMSIHIMNDNPFEHDR